MQEKDEKYTALYKTQVKKFSDGKDFFYLLVSMEDGKILITGFKTSKLNTIKKELECADIIQTFIQQGSKQKKDS